jgi:hypothetical protein
MKKDDKVKAFVGDKYIPGIVKDVENAVGFRRSYAYQRVYVEFLDESVKEFRDYDLIKVTEKESEEVITESKSKKKKD